GHIKPRLGTRDSHTEIAFRRQQQLHLIIPPEEVPGTNAQSGGAGGHLSGAPVGSHHGGRQRFTCAQNPKGRTALDTPGGEGLPTAFERPSLSGGEWLLLDRTERRFA